ncbi:MAG: ParA family protein [Polyangiaceae bacterium]|jgi:chromosome partitioning protein|nr:ParA family protein [Polyangiaceae bacterium]
MAKLSETCSVCGAPFEVQFRYQMEERDGGFSFYCSHKCLEQSQTSGAGGLVTCDACAKRFRVDLVSQVLYLQGRRRYACSTACRGQVLDEANGVRLGDMVEAPASRVQPAAVLERESPGVVGSTPAPEAARAPAVSGDKGSPPERPPPGSGASGGPEPVCLIPRVAPRAAPQESACNTNKSPPRIFAVFNHKGGTGKTTTSVSVAAGLAQTGKRVLIVDTDAQGNVAVSLNLKAEKSLYHVMVMGLPLRTVTQRVRENLDLVASNETLAAAELYLAGRQNRDKILRERLLPAVQGYDFVILDCSPSLSLMNQNALVLADSVLVPVACDYLSLVGVRQVLKTVRNVNQLLHHPVRLWGVLPTFYDARANICREAVETLQQHFGERCLPPVRSAIKVKEAPAHGQTIYEYAATSTAAEDYRVVVDRIVAEYGVIAKNETAGVEAASA